MRKRSILEGSRTWQRQEKSARFSRAGRHWKVRAFISGLQGFYRNYFIGVTQGIEAEYPTGDLQRPQIGTLSHRPGADAFHIQLPHGFSQVIIAFSGDFRFQIVYLFEEDGIYLLGFYELVDFDAAALNWFGAVEFFLIDKEKFPLLQLESSGLFFFRHRHFFVGANHLLFQPDAIAFVQQVKRNTLRLDCRMQL
jgi:hypothetical protein